MREPGKPLKVATTRNRTSTWVRATWRVILDKQVTAIIAA
jgi:hypothetical protein